MTFLGLRFDKHLTFKNQIAHLKKSCNERLNVLKVLSHHSWYIDKPTMIQLYKSLVRSLLDYSLFIYPIITNKNKRKLQYIQDSALRTILKKKFDYDKDLLHSETNIEKLESRSLLLLSNYFSQGLANKNPLVENLVAEFERFELTFKNNNIITLIDFIKNDQQINISIL